MKNNNNLHYQSAQALADALANRTISSVELLENTISRIEALDDKINAVVVRDFDNARHTAKKADEAISKGNHLPLLGLPITVKESFDVAGLPCTWGNPEFKNFIPSQDALTVQRLKAQGAIVIGKTNIPLMLKDWQSYNEVYGTTNNPWNFDVTPGGSSGGSAAALAAGFISLELGSDLAGSLRTPAHFCGVCTHKPSQDLIPMRGSSPPGTVSIPSGIDLVTSGPMARSAHDIELAFNILAGPDESLHGKGYTLNLPPARHQKLQDFRVLALNEHPLCPTAKEIQNAVDELATLCAKAGASVSSDATKAPSLAETTTVYADLMSPFVGAGMPIELYNELKVKASHIDPRDNSLFAHLFRGYAASYRDYFLSIRARETMRLQWADVFKDFDVIISPVMPTTAFPHDHSHIENRELIIDEQKISYFHQFIWVSIATLLGLPATVIPIATSHDRLPIGIQIIGPYLEDYTTLKFAQLIEDTFGGFSAPDIF